MTLQADTRRTIENLESAGYDTTPDGHEYMTCACGHEGQPSHVLPFDEVDEVEDDSRYFVCPGCGDY